MAKKPLSLTRFSSEEIIGAYKQFDNLYDDGIEAPREYLERKRSRDMQKIIRSIVENELDSTKREIFCRVFFDGEKINTVADELGICQSNAYKHYDKALKVIEQNLKYVLLYQNCCRLDRLTPLEKMKTDAFQTLKTMSVSAIAMRLFRLMQKENVEKKSLCRFLGFDEGHFDRIFCGALQPNAEEIVLLSGFFGVSADYILKGDLT